MRLASDYQWVTLIPVIPEWVTILQAVQISLMVLEMMCDEVMMDDYLMDDDSMRKDKDD